MKKTIIFFFLCFSLTTLAQTPQVNNHYYNYESKNTDFDGFKYNNQYYETSPRGLQSFIDDNKSDFSPELENILIDKVKKIKTKKLVSEIGGWGLWAAGAGVMMSSIASGKDANGNQDTNRIFTGLGIAIAGALVRTFISPKNRHYYDFLNTINRENSKKVYLEVTMNHNKNFNFGLALNF